MTFPITEKVTIIPVVDTDIFAATDVLFADTLLAAVAREDGGSVTLVSIAGRDLAKQDSAIDLYFFDSEPATGTYAINGAFDLNDTDADLFVGHVAIVAGNYSDGNDNSVFTKRNIGLQMKCLTVDDLYVIGVCRGTPTYAAATDLSFTFSFLQE